MDRSWNRVRRNHPAGLRPGLCGAMVLTVCFGLQTAVSEAAPPQLSFTLKSAGFVEPVHITGAGDGSGRLFVVERRGVIRVLQGDAGADPSPS